MRAAKLLEENPNPTEEEVRFGMAEIFVAARVTKIS